MMTRDELSSARRFAPGSYVIGTDPKCSVILSDPVLEARHARVELTEHYVVVEPLGPELSLELNGIPIHAAQKAFSPVTLTLGNFSLTFTRDPTPPEDEPLTLSSTRTTRTRSLSIRTEVGGIPNNDLTECTPPEDWETEFPTLAIQMPAELGAEISGELSVSVSYGLQQELARGGMGRIFVGQDPSLGREVAVKVATVDHPDSAEAFDKEARVLGWHTVFLSFTGISFSHHLRGARVLHPSHAR
jgi:hypothetical protein